MSVNVISKKLIACAKDAELVPPSFDFQIEFDPITAGFTKSGRAKTRTWDLSLIRAAL